MATPTRPKNVPADAVWNDDENEWELGAKKNGKETGVWTWWRPTGKIVCRSHYDGRPGNLHGPFQRFHPNGEVCLEGTYENGKPVGIHFWQFSSAKSDQPFFYTNILSVARGVKKVVVDYKEGRGFNMELAETARFYDAKGVETDRKGVPLTDMPAPAADLPVAAGRDTARMIGLLFGKKTPARTAPGKTWVERELFASAMKGVDASGIRFFGHPTDQYGTWLLDGSDRWDTMGYDSWLWCLERAVDSSKDYDGDDGSLVGCAGFFWLPVCGLVGVAYQQNEGGVDAYMVSGLLREKTATVYSWLTSHTSGGEHSLRFDSPSISQLLCWLTDRDENDPEGEDEDSDAVGRLPKVHFVAAGKLKVDPEKYWDKRWNRKGFEAGTDPQVLCWRARWILAAARGAEPKALKEWLQASAKFRNWEDWRKRSDPLPTTILYWILHHYIYGNPGELAETLAKARKVRGFSLLADLDKALSRKNGTLKDFPVEQIRKGLRSAGEKLGPAAGGDETPVLGTDKKAKEALALLDALERRSNANEGPNPWYRDSGSEEVRRFAELVDDRFRDLVRGKLAKALKVGEHKPGATRGLLLAWGKLAPDYPAFRDVVKTVKPGTLGLERGYELAAAQRRFLDDAAARAELLKLALAWIKNSWNDSRSSEPVWTLLERDTPETRKAVARLLETATFGAPTWETGLAAVEAAAKFRMKEAVPGLRRAVKEEFGRVDDPSRARVARALAEVEGKGALPFLRKRFDDIVAKMDQEGNSYLRNDLPALISALLILTPDNRDVLAQARAVLKAPFKSLDTDPDTRTHLLEAVLQGARHSKALRPQAKAVATRADIPKALKTLAVEVSKG